MKENKIGVLTIGQAPRIDLIYDIKFLLPNNILIVEKGALDNLNEEQIQELYPTDEEATFVSRLRNGKSVNISEHRLLPLIHEKIHELEKEQVDVIVMACTGRFPSFDCKVPILYPDQLLSHTISGMFSSIKLGVIMPLDKQEKYIKEKWEKPGFVAITAAASPYEFSKEQLIFAGTSLLVQGAECIALDCIGYTQEMKDIVRNATNLPVLLPRNIVFLLARELCS